MSDRGANSIKSFPCSITLIEDTNMKFDLFAYQVDDGNSMNSSNFILTVILIHGSTFSIYAHFLTNYFIYLRR